MQDVFITGIDKGIGKALAQKFLREGFRVMGTYFNAPPILEGDPILLQLDLSSGDSIVTCVQTVQTLGGKIDILFSNAGILADEDETVVVVEKLRKTLEVNLIGTIDLIERLIPFMNTGGHILNVSSTAGSLELAGRGASHFPGHYPAYKISKAALNMYTRTLALRLKDEGLTVSAVHPGWVKTNIGGEEADLTPEQAAEGMFKVATSRPATGGFWFAGEPVPW